MHRGSIIIVFLFLSGSLFSQSISFVKEKIEMSIVDSSFAINGKYYFINNSSKEINTNFYYPFVINKNFQFPDSISIKNEDNVRVFYSKGKDGIFFNIKTMPQDSSEFTAYYRQKNLIKKAEYILTTTHNWNVPLQKAEYLIYLPNNLSLKSISLQPDSIKNGSTYKTYFITKENFMPLVNLIVEWERSEK